MRSHATASIGFVIGGALWGLIRLSLHDLEGLGLPGAGSGLSLYVGAALVLLPLWASGRFGRGAGQAGPRHNHRALNLLGIGSPAPYFPRAHAIGATPCRSTALAIFSA